MDFTKTKDDPHGVQRLLDILRRQQDASSSSSTATSSDSTVAHPPTSSTSAYPSNPFLNAPTSSEAYVLQDAVTESVHSADAARRQTYNTTSSKYGLSSSSLSAPSTVSHAAADAPFDPYSFNPFSSAAPVLTHPITAAPPPSQPKPASKPSPLPSASTSRDLASLSFAESLPILSTLANDKALLKRLRALRQEQHDLERRLGKEYTQFRGTADRQYPNAKQRRQMDEERRHKMLLQWDACVRAQQDELMRAGVPGVKPSQDRKQVDKQKKILSVLVEMLDDQED